MSENIHTADVCFSYCRKTICHRVCDFVPTGVVESCSKPIGILLRHLMHGDGVNLKKFGIFRVSFEAKGLREEREKGIFIVSARKDLSFG